MEPGFLGGASVYGRYIIVLYLFLFDARSVEKTIFPRPCSHAEPVVSAPAAAE